MVPNSNLSVHIVLGKVVHTEKLLLLSGEASDEASVLGKAARENWRASAHRLHAVGLANGTMTIDPLHIICGRFDQGRSGRLPAWRNELPLGRDGGAHCRGGGFERQLPAQRHVKRVA